MFYTKEEILTMYLNTVDFGSNAYGIKTASNTYFHITPQDITYEQAATKETIRKSYSCQGLHHPKNTDSIAINLPDSLQENEEDILTSLKKSKEGIFLVN